MSEKVPSTLAAKLEGLEPIAPRYDYEGLSLPANLTIDALFSSHEDIGDLGPEGIEEQRHMLQTYDVVVIECPGWLERTVKTLQKITKGDYREYQRVLEYHHGRDDGESRWTVATAKVLYNLKKPLVIIDPPAQHHSSAAAQMYYQSVESPAKAGLAKEVEEIRDSELKYAQANLAREDYMLRSFVEQISGLTTSQPRLREKLAKNGVNVVMWAFGGTHAGLYNGIQEVARRNNTPISGSPTLFNAEHMAASYHTQINGRYLRGMEIDDLLITREAVSRLVLNNKTRGVDVPFTQLELEVVSQVDAMSVDELESTYRSLASMNILSTHTEL